MQFQMADQLFQTGRFQEALPLYQQALQQDPEHIDNNFKVGLIYHYLGQTQAAAQQLAKVISLEPAHFTARITLAESYYQMGNLEKMNKELEQLLILAENNFQAMCQLGDFYRKHSLYRESQACYEKAAVLDGTNAELFKYMAVNLNALGQFEEALGNIRKTLTIKPDHAEAYKMLASASNSDINQKDIESITALLADSDTQPLDRMYLSYALGVAEEKRKNYAQAFSFFQQANEIEKQRYSHYKVDQDIEVMEQVQQVFNEAFFNQHQGLGDPSKGAIFILGMPRSGSSLIEQILASHSNVYGGGEVVLMSRFLEGIKGITGEMFPGGLEKFDNALYQQLGQQYLQRLRLYSQSPEQEYITNKMPTNFVLIGLIKIMLPNAKIIHSKRNSMDTCLSCYKNSFGQPQPYTHDLQDLARYHLAHDKLMQHWHSVLPFQIYSAEYESLVENPEEEIRALLNYCDLPFEENCLNFHQTERAVATLSFNQVREPIYKKAVAGWEKYRSQLGDLERALNFTSDGIQE